MADGNSPRSKMQIVVVCAGVVMVMLLAAVAFRSVGGSGGLRMPTSSGSASGR